MHQRTGRSLWLLTVLLVASLGCNAEERSLAEVEQCLKLEGDPKATTFKDFVNQSPASLRPHRTWASQKPAAVQVTVATALTPTRLEQLEAQCSSWKGPLSAAVYAAFVAPEGGEIPSDQLDKLREWEQKLDAFHAKMEDADYCQLDMVLAYEVVAEPLMKELLPINTMRNYALLLARTELVAMIDVDLIISKHLFEWLGVPEQYKQLRQDCARKLVYVLPAFETRPHHNITEAHEIARQSTLVSKPELEKMVLEKKLQQFALSIFKRGHNATDYARWWRSTKQYAVNYQISYEPWFIIDRRLNPFYDERFRGYGWNKVTQVDNVYAQSFKFWAHPTGFIVHRQHDRSVADKMYQSQKKAGLTSENALHTLTYKFRNHVLHEIRHSYYQPLVDGGVDACLRQLSWWAGDPVPVYTTKAKPDPTVKKQPGQQ